MALFSKKDFSLLCGLKTKDLAVYIKRGKVILSGDYIDDSLDANRSFVLKRKSSGKNQEVKPEEPNISTPNYSSLTKVKSKISTEDGKGLYALEKEKKALDIEKTTEEIALLQIKKEKQQGIVIPTDLVKIVFTQHSKSIVSSFHSAADTFLMQIAKKKGINRNEMAEFREELTNIINVAVEDSIKESKKQIKNIISEYSEKKGVGEKL